MKMKLGEPGEVFQGLFCADFVKNDEKFEIMMLQPKRRLSFAPISVSLATMTLRIEQLHWDDILISHDVVALPQDEIDVWFQYWFDPKDERRDKHALLSNNVHSLIIKPGAVGIDFGTAPKDALWEMVGILSGAGATEIRISDSQEQSAA